MLLGISLEVSVPETVDHGELHRIGVEVVPNPSEGFTTTEMLEWAFRSPGAITALHALGVRWTSAATGAPVEEADLTASAPTITTDQKENTPCL